MPTERFDVVVAGGLRVARPTGDLPYVVGLASALLKRGYTVFLRCHVSYTAELVLVELRPDGDTVEITTANEFDRLICDRIRTILDNRQGAA